jgi:hypothetical protein
MARIISRKILVARHWPMLSPSGFERIAVYLPILRVRRGDRWIGSARLIGYAPRDQQVLL